MKKSKPKRIRESKIEDAVCKYARETYDMEAYKFTSPARSAVPDRLFITKQGRVFFIEFKASWENEATAPQEREHAKLRGRGMFVFLVNDIAFGKGVIDGMAM
jgi:hypothetical protein